MTPFEASQVQAEGTLRDVLYALDRSGLGVALVVDHTDRLVGILTDGDVRRALLAGQTLDGAVGPIAQRAFASVQPAASRAEVLDLMRARRIDVVPIVDGDGRLAGCHQLHDVVGVVARRNAAVIMAGGLGSRLGALTASVPKPMLRVAGRPILERLVLHLVGHGVRRIFLSINYLGHLIEAHFGDGSQFGCAIEYLRETQPLGTAGPLGLLPELPTSPILVVNGDLVTQADIGALLDTHDASPNTAMTVAVRRYMHTVPFGCVDIIDGAISDIEEKPTLSRMINAGMYVLAPSVVERVDPHVDRGMPALISDCLARSERVQSFEILDDWIDVGQKEQLRQAQGEIT